MNDLTFRARSLYPEEVAYIKAKLREASGCRLSGAPFVFVVFVLLGALLVHNLQTESGFMLWIYGVLAVVVGLVLTVIALSWYTSFRDGRMEKRSLLAILETRSVEVCSLEATRIAQAELHVFDELLFIVELSTGDILFLREEVHRIFWGEVPEGSHKFPCLQFDVYKDPQYLEGMVHPLSAKIKPIIIAPDAMGGFVDKYGEPSHMELCDLPFDSLISDIRACAFD